jgi:hypothetical protein
MAAIMPTQVRRPKQKASVEGPVGKIATAVIAKLRNERFYSMDTLKSAVFGAVDEFNHTPFQKREGSRFEVYRQEERAFLRPLPQIPYEIATWVYNRSIYLDCHVVHKKNHYSCPYQYAAKKEKVDLKVTDSFVEIYCRGERIATHKRFPDHLSGQWSTHPEDMPNRFAQIQWDDERIRKWADAIGHSAAEVIDRIFASVKINEQGYNSSLAELLLSKKYTPPRLEAACALALTRFHSPRYRHLQAILSAEEDVLYHTQQQEEQKRRENASMGFVRGAAYYGGIRHNGGGLDHDE